MSSYEAKDFRVGEPIDSEVAKHIDLLQNVFGAKDGSSRQTYIELQGALPWVKMQSGVKLSAAAALEYNTTAGDALAKANILFGLNARTSYEDEKGVSHTSYTPNTNSILPGYEQSKDLGIRPRPGITSMNIQSHNRFGSLRTATVSYQCWTKEQIDVMEVLYMRPGMTVLLEWGHSKVLKSKAEVVPSDFGIDYFTAGDSIPKLISNIHNKRKQSKYSYDAIVGIIKNFSWSFRPDGGYDCRVDLVTSGDLIESYKANFFLKQSVLEELVNQQVEKYKDENNITGSLNIEFPNVLYDSKTSYNLADIPALDGLYGEFCGALESALASAPSYFESYINSLEEEKRKDIYKEANFKPALRNDLPKALEQAKKILGSLSLVKGGATLAKATKKYKTSSTGYEEVGTVEIKSQSPWANGIVNFNTADLNNDLENGKVEAGYAAILPLRGDYPSMPDLLAVFDEISDLGKKGHTQALASALNLLKYARFSDGQAYKQIFAFPGFSNFTGPTPIKYKPTISTSEPLIQEIRQASASEDRNMLIGNDGIFSYAQWDKAYQANFYSLEDTLPANLSPSPVAGASTYEYSLKTYISGTSNAVDKFGKSRIFPTQLAPAAFGKVKFTGFKLIRDASADLTQAVAVIDSETGQAVTEILDPNDDNVSKLHYYLRAVIENVYVSRYLKQTLAGNNFSKVFNYRPLYGDNSSVPEEIETLFGFSESAKVRKENLEVYGGYENQLKAWNLILGGRFALRDNASNYNTVYIKLGALLELINRHVLQSETNYFYLFKTTYKDAESTPLYRTLDDHLSVDPEICILPHSISKLKIPGHDPSYLIGKDEPIILNIELNINFLLSTLTSYIDSDGSVSLLTYLQEILDQVSKVCGGVNDLQLQYMEDAGLFYVVDRTAIAPYPLSKYEKINVFGLNSIVRNVNMVSKITPKMSSMIAISAQDTAFTSTEESTGFAALNRGVTDRMYSDRYDEDRKAKDAAVDYDALRTSLLNDVVDLKEQLRTYYEYRTVPAVGKDTRVGVYENYCKFLLGADSKYRVGGRPTYNFIIPFELQLELYGLSGIQVMDAFVLNKDVLPKTYGGKANSPIAFLVTGVEHTINRGSWITRLKTQIFNIEETLTTNPTAPAFGLVNGIPPNGFPLKVTSSSKAFSENMPNHQPGLRPKWAPIEKDKSVAATSLIQAFRKLKNRPHYGIDFAASENLKCIAVCDGVWAAGGNDPNGYGDTWGYLKEYDSEGKHIRSHVYGHTNKTMFKNGAKVKKGDVVALVGNKGSSTGAHVHYEIWLPNKSKRYDAAVYLNETTPPAGVNVF